jgi:hypothetical protein
MESGKKITEKRTSVRRHLYHLTKMRIGTGLPLRDCLILDISDGGVRLYVGGLNVPDKFNLLLGEDVVSECSYEVIWRRDREIGAKLVSPSLPLLEPCNPGDSETSIMLSPKAKERRRAPRYPCERLAKIQGNPPRRTSSRPVNGRDGPNPIPSAPDLLSSDRERPISEHGPAEDCTSLRPCSAANPAASRSCTTADVLV